MQSRQKSTRQMFKDYLFQQQQLGFERTYWTLPDPKTVKKRSATPAESLVRPVPPETLERLNQLEKEVSVCTKCRLCHSRKQTVFADGNPGAALAFVGEAPGYDEDRQGKPFVGKAGQLLTKIIQAMHLTREQVYICNIVKCHPPENRNPEPDEMISCEPYLIEQLSLVKPRILCALGRFGAQGLLKTKTPISRMRGNWYEYEGIPVMPTFHPAYLLRNPSEKRLVWEDMKQIMRRLGIEV